MSIDPNLPPPLLRALPEFHLKNLAQDLGLHEFARKPKERRAKHLAGVEDAKRYLQGQIGVPPPDATLRNAVAMTLEYDQSFQAYVANNGGREYLSTEAGSKNVVLAGAGAILCQYFKMQEAPA